MPNVFEFAAAKVNLSLRVLGRRPDGFHELDSLVVFADVGDRVRFTPGQGAGLRTHGPFASSIDGDNLIGTVVTTLKAAYPEIELGAFDLEKVLPVAAGLGGGSADAAAALRAIQTVIPEVLTSTTASKLAYGIGADVPVCLLSKAAFMRGLGERVERIANFQAINAVLVNPGVQLSTQAVFRALKAEPIATSEQPTDSPHAFETFADLIAFLAREPNDLEAPAKQLQPAIALVLNRLRACEGCRLARMSGSGPTCFAIFGASDDADKAAKSLQATHPNWWVRQTVLA